MLPVLVDSTYLLPVFGIEVEGVSGQDLLELRSLALEGMLKLYYSPVSLLEIVAKAARESLRRGGGLTPEEVEVAIRVIERSEYLQPINPDSRVYSLAYRMRLLGHKDMIDNILYATATVNRMVFLTMDAKLNEFIRQHSLEGATLMNHEELFAVVRK